MSDYWAGKFPLVKMSGSEGCTTNGYVISQNVWDIERDMERITYPTAFGDSPVIAFAHWPRKFSSVSEGFDAELVAMTRVTRKPKVNYDRGHELILGRRPGSGSGKPHRKRSYSHSSTHSRHGNG